MKRAKKQKTSPDVEILARSLAIEKGVQAFLLAGAEVLRTEFKFEQDDIEKWVTATIALGTKYLRITQGHSNDGSNNALSSESEALHD